MAKKNRSNGANNTLEPDALWMLLAPVYCTLVSPSHFLYVLYLFEGREKRGTYFKLRYGYLLWFSTLSHFSFVSFFIVFKKEIKKIYLLIFFLNVIATKMYIFKKNGDSVKWCSIEIKREKLYRFHSRVHHSLQFPFFSPQWNNKAAVFIDLIRIITEFCRGFVKKNPIEQTATSPLCCTKHVRWWGSCLYTSSSFPASVAGGTADLSALPPRLNLCSNSSANEGITCV